MKLPGIALGLCIATIASLHAAETALKTADSQPPKEAAEAVIKVLQPKAVQVVQGDKPALQFWWRSAIPLKAAPESPAKGLAALEELTFLGVVSLSEGHRDYKDNEIPAGTYSIRFGLQPQDGDHLGTAEFPYFAVLLPIKADTDPSGIKTYKAMVKASGKATATGHPAVLSLRPASVDGGQAPKLTAPAEDHKAILFKLPAKAAGAPADLIFELVYEGKCKS